MKTQTSKGAGWRRGVAVVAVLALAAACGGGQDASEDDVVDTSGNGEENGGDQAGDEDPAAGDPVDLTVSVWTTDEAQLALLDEIADDYLEQTPEVASIRFDSSPFDTYHNALTVQLAGGNPPDLGWMGNADVAPLIESGAITEVGDALREDPEYDFDDIIDSTFDSWRRGDEIYGYQFSNSPDGIFYDAEAFEAAGVDTPMEQWEAGEWTWEALAESARQVVDADAARYGLVLTGFDYSVWQTLRVVYLPYGAQSWTDNGEECGWDSPEMIDAMTLFHDMIFTDGTYPGPGESADFAAGDVAMMSAKASAAGQLEGVDFAWDVVPLPTGPAGDVASYGGAGMTVFSAGDNTEAATDFLKFWTNPDNTRKMAQYFPPPRESVLQPDVLADSNPLLSAEQLQRMVVDAVPRIANDPQIPPLNQAQLTETVGPLLDELWQPDADVTTTLEGVCEGIEPLLGDA